MLNQPQNKIFKQQARVKYGASDFHVVGLGDHVICATTGKPIAIGDLKYWNAERQEAYIDAAASLQAEQKHRK